MSQPGPHPPFGSAPGGRNLGPATPHEDSGESSEASWWDSEPIAPAPGLAAVPNADPVNTSEDHLAPVEDAGAEPAGAAPVDDFFGPGPVGVPGPGERMGWVAEPPAEARSPRPIDDPGHDWFRPSQEPPRDAFGEPFGYASLDPGVGPGVGHAPLDNNPLDNDPLEHASDAPWWDLQPPGPAPRPAEPHLPDPDWTGREQPWVREDPNSAFARPGADSYYPQIHTPSVLHPLPGEPGPAPAAAGGPGTTSAQPSFGSVRGGPTLPVDDRHATTATGAPAAAPSTSPAEPRSPRRSGPLRGLPLRIIVGALVGVLVLSGVVALAITQFRTPATTTTTVARELSRPAPPGWQPTFAWSTDLPALNGSIAVGQNHVAFIDSRGALNVVNADSGQPAFTSAVNNLSSSARPFVSVTQGTPVAGIVDGANLMLWPLAAKPGAEGHQITLALNARVFQQGGGLMVSTGKEHWVVTSASTLSPVTLAADHVALGVTPDGMLLSAPPRGSWTIHSANPNAAPKEIRPEGAPEGTQGEMQVAWASRGVIVAWGNTGDREQRTVGLYDATTGRLLAGHTLPTSVVQNGLPLTVSPNSEFASAGPMLARLDNGEVTVVDRWSTIMSDARHLYGTRDGARMAWNGGDPVELDPRAVIPWGTSERGYAIVLEQLESSRVRLGGLRPA